MNRTSATGMSPAQTSCFMTVGNVETGNAFGLTAEGALVLQLPSKLFYLKPLGGAVYPFQAGAYLTDRP